MLVATRDPMPHQRAPDHDRSRPAAAAAPPRITRFMTALQLFGSLLAIPVGLASGYSIYRANFAVETRCEILRGNIINMIDKQLDAGTRRMLVRRDVETFERNCGGFDPDAGAAFKRLLAQGRPSAAPRAAAAEQATAPKAEPQATANVTTVAKQPVSSSGAMHTAEREVNVPGDARWLASVRNALVSPPDRHQTPVAEGDTQARALAAPPKPLGTLTVTAPTAPAVAAPLQVAPVPPPLVSPPAVRPAEFDRPVPPAPIPEPAASIGAPGRSNWVENIPVLGSVLAH